MLSLFRRTAAADRWLVPLWAVAIGLVIWPAAAVFRRVWAMEPPAAAAEQIRFLANWSGPKALGQTALWCSVIGLAAASLALVWAWWMRGLGRRGRIWAMGVGLAPLLLPSYLAYAGWNLLRSPGTWLGDALAMGPAWMSTAAWRGFAALGLVLWVWPLALLVLWPAAMRIPQNVLDAMRADGAPRHIRGAEVLGMLARDVLRASGLCALVMAGSAIPLHVAQVNTYTIWLWSEMNRVPDTRGVWIASLPVLALAMLGALFIVRIVPAIPRDDGETDEREAARTSRRPALATLVQTAAACGIWAVSVIVPLLLFVLSVREPAAFAGFWRETGRAIGNGLAIGACVGAIGAAVLLLTWRAVSAAAGPMQRRRVSAPILWLTFAGLVPGVLVGSALAMLAPFSGIALVVVTHSVRFVFIAALIGLWLGASEPAEQRSLRQIDGGNTLRGWLAVCVRPRWGTVAGTAIALGLLSLHEIESTVQVQPPGLDNLAQYLLDQLHYLRQDQLAAAGATMTGIGLVGAVAAGLLLAKSRGRISERS